MFYSSYTCWLFVMYVCMYFYVCCLVVYVCIYAVVVCFGWVCARAARSICCGVGKIKAKARGCLLLEHPAGAWSD